MVARQVKQSEAVSLQDGDGAAGELDKHIGTRLRVRRVLLGMSQQALASRLGVSFQQIQKYEKGTNRISASRLYRAAQVLEVPVTYFFEQYETDSSTSDEQFDANDPMSLDTRYSLLLLRAASRVQNRKAREHLLGLFQSMADDDENDNPVVA